MKKYILFTDLDGTLLDSDSYRWDAAADAVEFLKSNGIPIIPCTSKTHPEVITLRRQLQIDDPFIVENGSAIFYPAGYFNSVDWPETKYDDFRARVLGKTYPAILSFFAELKGIHQTDMTGFNEMSAAQISALTSLSLSDAQIAKNRFFSEPFILNKQADLPLEIAEHIKKNGFRLLKGNRFYHLLGNTDKGEAVLKLTRMFADLYQPDKLQTIGIGDSMNDLEMLRNVDFPALVRKSNGRHQSGININQLTLTQGVGPAGWNEAVFKLLAME